MGGNFDGPEDPFVWVDRKGHYHCLMHAWPMPWGPHAYSADGKEWHYAPVTDGTCYHFNRPCAYDGNVTLQDGNEAVRRVTLLARERPHLVLDENGTPLALTNGAVFPQLKNGNGMPCRSADLTGVRSAMQSGVRGVGYGCDRSVTFVTRIRQKRDSNLEIVV